MEEALEFRNVSVIHNGVHILDGIDLDVDSGENVAIIGLNGSGKTALLKLLRGDVYLYDNGAECSMKVFGEKHWNIWELKAKMGVVSMDLQSLFNEHTKVREVIGSGFFGSLDVFCNNTITEKMAEIIRLRAEEMGVDDLLDREVGGLSLGEMKRTLIARALITNPRMLVFDEPVTGLDSVMKSKFRRMFDILVDAGVNIVMTTHDLSDIPFNLDRVVMICDEKIYADGKKGDLLNEKTVSGVYRALIKIECENGIYRMHINGEVE